MRAARQKNSLPEAVRFVAEAWCSVTAETIQNCFKKSGIGSGGKYIN